MSADLILGLIVGVVSIVATIAVARWQLFHGEQKKKSLPPKILVTYFALRALVAAHRKTDKANAGLTADELYHQIIEDCNTHTSGGNFDPGGKNKLLRSYIADSIKKLRNPGHKALGQLIEVRDGNFTVTSVGEETFDKLPVEPSECPSRLDAYLSGSIGLSSGISHSTAAKTSMSRAPISSYKRKEMRYLVFMAMPDEEPLDRTELHIRVKQDLSLKVLRGSTLKKVEQAIDWNLKNTKFAEESDGRICLAVPKAGKTLDDFKDRK